MERLGLIGACVVVFLGMQSGVGRAEDPTPANSSPPPAGTLANSPQSPAGPAAKAANAAAQPAAIVGVGSPELTRLSTLIMKNPKDTALNLRYAELAEQLGIPRLALTAYERILSYDPYNAEALAGIDRIRRKIQPNTTRYFVAGGITAESNPTFAPQGMTKGEFQTFGNFQVADDRSLGDWRWRTLGYANGTLHGLDEMLDYAYAGATTGPVFEMMPGVEVNPMLGGGGSYFDNHLFYGEAIARMDFVGYPGGSRELVSFRAAFRDYDTFFVPQQYGGYVEATGKFTLPLEVPNTVFSFAPWLRWAAIKGPLGAVTTVTAIAPGDYTDVGARFDAYHSIEDFAIFGVNIAGSERFYRDEMVVGGTAQRRDKTVSPGAALVIPHIFQYENSLRFEYNYIWNASNDVTKQFVDHIFTVTATRNF